MPSRKKKPKSRQSLKSVASMMPRSRTLFKFLDEEWDSFKEVCNRRWKGINGTLLKGGFSMSDVLGSGYFGIVISTTHKKLVVKVTSDQDEGYFNQLILNDDYLRYSPGLPFVFDCFHIPEWGAYVILRENVHFGIDTLPESSPLARSIGVLDVYGEKAIRIESRVAKMLNSLQGVQSNVSKSNFVYAYREAQGLMRTEIIKALKKLPNVSEGSKYFHAMDVIAHSLDKYGIALWDLHTMNLGRHRYDMSELTDEAPPLDKDCILILDVGGNFGSPIMAQMIEEIDI